MAKFPHPANPTDDEHGYPVSALDSKRSIQHRPPSAVIDQWLSAGLVDADQAELVRRGKV